MIVHSIAMAQHWAFTVYVDTPTGWGGGKGLMVWLCQLRCAEGLAGVRLVLNKESLCAIRN
jgi:hypothetical protein